MLEDQEFDQDAWEDAAWSDGEVVAALALVFGLAALGTLIAVWLGIV